MESKTKDILSKQLDYQKHQVHYLKFGQGKRFLFAFHGFADYAYLFPPLEEALGEEYSIIAIDLPFHGYTKWQSHIFRPKDLVAVLQLIMQKEQIQSFSMMGHSMGGRIILALAPYFKEQLEELILLAPAGFQNSVSDSTWLFPKFVRQFLKALTRQKKVILNIFHFGKRVGIINRGLHQFVCAQIEREDRRQRLFDCWISLYHFPIQLRQFKHLLHTQGIPISFFYGEEDYITPAKYGRRFASDLPQAQVLMVADNHFLLRDSLAPLIESLSIWLNTKQR